MLWCAGADLLRIVGILSVGMVATLMFTAQITVAIREAVKTPVKEIAKAKPSPPFMNLHYIAWGTIFAASLAAIAVGGPQLAAQAALPYGLAVTLGGFLIGEWPVGVWGAKDGKQASPMCMWAVLHVEKRGAGSYLFS